MYQHVCQGAECPHCSPFVLRQGATVLAGKLNRANAERQRQLRKFRDGRGEPITTWPKGPYPRPSTTVIVLQTPHWLPHKPWQVLCQQRTDNGWWGFPGGGLENGESLIECAHRETLEETGLSIRVYGAVCQDSDPTFHACCVYPNGVMQYANTTFLASSVSGILRGSEESCQVGWFATDALPQPFLLSHRWRLERAMAHRGAFLPVR